MSLGKKRAYDKVTETVKRALQERMIDLERYTFALGWGYSQEEAKPYFDRIRKLFLSEFGIIPEFVPIQIGATIGVHTGPHPVGIGLIEKA